MSPTLYEPIDEADMVVWPNGRYVLASDYDALSAQLNRTREWMRHKPECCAPKAGEQDCCCGLRAFIEEVGEI